MHKYKRTPAVMESNRLICVRHLKVACDGYKSEVRRGRYFLHEHPWSASSLKADDLQEVMRLPGVQVVKGPMRRWVMRGTDFNGNECYIRKQCGWMTNCSELAELLRGECANEKSGKEQHRHVVLLGASQRWPGFVLKVRKAAMTGEGTLAVVDA